MKKKVILSFALSFFAMSSHFSFAEANSQITIEQLKLIQEKVGALDPKDLQDMKTGKILLDRIFAEAGLVEEISSDDDDDHHTGGTYPSSYTSSTYPSSYTSSTYPSSYTSSTYPSSYTSSSYPSSYTSSSYPSSYSASSYPSSYTSSNYRSMNTDDSPQDHTGSVDHAVELQKQRYRALPVPELQLSH